LQQLDPSEEAAIARFMTAETGDKQRSLHALITSKLAEKRIELDTLMSQTGEDNLQVPFLSTFNSHRSPRRVIVCIPALHDAFLADPATRPGRCGDVHGSGRAVVAISQWQDPQGLQDHPETRELGANPAVSAHAIRVFAMRSQRASGESGVLAV
jgi:hypothetical protein